MSKRGITGLAKKNLLAGMKQTKVKRCVHCLEEKQKRVSFHSHPPSRMSELLDQVQSDMYGPFKMKSKGGALYFSTFIDDHSCKIWVYPLKSKDEVLYVFKQFQALSEIQTGKKVKYIRTDNGGEYIGSFDDYFRLQEIRHQKTPPKTPQLNSLAERMNRTLVERVRCVLSEGKLPNSF